MANYENVEMDLDSDNSHSSQGSGSGHSGSIPPLLPATKRDVTRRYASPPRRHRSPPARRGDHASRDSRPTSHNDSRRVDRHHMRSPDRYRGDRRRDHRQYDRHARHERDRRSTHRSSRDYHQRSSRRRSRSVERRRRHNSSSASPVAVASSASPSSEVSTSGCSRVSPDAASVSISTISSSATLPVSSSFTTTTASNGSVPSPDVSRVLERVERLRRQGCLSAYQQIMGSVQGALNTLVTPSLAQHPQAANIPKFYNPAAINIAKIADQERKKKLLWGNKAKTSSEEQSSTAWKPVAAFESDEDGKVSAKFLRLMGVKDAGGSAVPSSSDKLSETVRKQQRMFDDMEQQYEQARMSTHTQRGFGLGYTAQYYQPKF